MPRRVEPATATSGIEIAPAGKPSTVVGTVLIGAIAIVALYFGRDVFVPMALAILLSFALAPSALLLRRCHFGRVPSVIAVVVVTFIAISGLGVLIGDQFAYLADNLPQIPVQHHRKDPFVARSGNKWGPRRADYNDVQGSRQRDLEAK